MYLFYFNFYLILFYYFYAFHCIFVMYATVYYFYTVFLYCTLSTNFIINIINK